MVDLQGQPAERYLFAAEQTLVSKTAADIGRDDAHVAVFEPETLRKPSLHRVGKLRRGDQCQISQTRIAVRQDATPLHWKHAVPGGPDSAAHFDGRGFGDLIDRGILR